MSLRAYVAAVSVSDYTRAEEQRGGVKKGGGERKRLTNVTNADRLRQLPGDMVHHTSRNLSPH